MDIGTLEIKLMADMAQLRKDMDDAKGAVTGAMGGIESAVNVAKAAFVALGGAAAVSAFAGMINGAIESAAALKDMSVATGASVESLSRFTEVGRTTNTSADAIAGMMNKLAKASTGTAEETKGAGAAITALGINFETFKQMSPDEKLTTVASAMNKFQDGSEKSAAAMQLLGKSGADALPYLKDLATTGDVVARVTKEQAEASDNFSDNLTTLKASGEAWKTELAMGMVPALDNAASAMVDVFNETGGLREEIRKLSQDGTISAWTTSAISGLTRVSDVFTGFGRVVVSVGEVIGAWAAMVVEGFSATFTAIGQAVTGNFGAAMDTMKGMLTNQKNTVSDLGDKLSNTWSEETLGQKLRARMGEMKDMGDTSEATKPKLDVSAVLAKSEESRKSETAAMKAQEAAARAHTAEVKKQEESYNKLIGSINEKITAMEAEMTQGTKLTAAQLAEIKLLADLDSGTLKLTASQRDNTLAAIANQGAVEAKYKAYLEDKKQTEQNTKENDKHLESLQNTTTALEKDTEKMRDNLNEMGLSREELTLLSAAKDIDKAATLERSAAVLDAGGPETATTEEMRRQAAALRDLAGLKEQGIHVRAAVEARNAWEATTRSIGTGLSSALTDAVANGKDIWLTFRDFMVRTIIDGVIKNALASVISDGLNSLIGSITGIKLGSGGNGTSLLSAGVNAVTGGIDKAVTAVTGSTVGELASSVGSTLGIGGATTAGATTLGGASSLSGALSVGGGFEVGGGALTAATADTAALTSASSATSGAYAVAAPVAAAVAIFSIMNGLRSDGSSLTYQRRFDASGSDVTQQDGVWGRRNAEFSGVIDSMVSQYITVAKSLGIQPKDGLWGYQTASDGTVNASSSVGGSNYLAGWLPMAQASEIQTKAIVSALRGSTSEADKLAAISGMFPGFANGGLFGGGLRIVGERGPELEATGPARIFDAATTASMLRSGGATDSELVSEMRAIRRALEAMLTDTRRTADATNGKPEAPMIVEIET